MSKVSRKDLELLRGDLTIKAFRKGSDFWREDFTAVPSGVPGVALGLQLADCLGGVRKMHEKETKGDKDLKGNEQHHITIFYKLFQSTLLIINIAILRGGIVEN